MMTFAQFYYEPNTEVDRLFEHVLAARRSGCPRARTPSTETGRAKSLHGDTYRPRLDLYESRESNTVTASFELPGLASDDVAIDVRQNSLTVSGELAELAAPTSEEEEKKNYVVRERRSGKFSRALQLPFGIKPDDVKAKMEDGILTITFPKTSPEEGARRIPIQ